MKASPSVVPEQQAQRSGSGNRFRAAPPQAEVPEFPFRGQAGSPFRYLILGQADLEQTPLHREPTIKT